MNETSVCLPCAPGILYKNNELEGGESMFPKARPPPYPTPTLFIKDLLCFKQSRGEAGEYAEIWGSSGVWGAGGSYLETQEPNPSALVLV